MNSKLDNLKSFLEKLAYLGSTISLLSWDQQAKMPKGASEHRANQIAYLEKLHHQMHTSSEFTSMLEAFVDLKSGVIVDFDLDNIEQKMVAEVWRDWHFASCLPSEFVEEYSRVQSESFMAWERAKTTNQFSEFAPFLEKIIKLSKQKAKLLNPQVSPYDALIDQYEPNMTSDKLDKLFSALKLDIIELVKKIKSKKTKLYSVKNYKWPKESQNEFINTVLNDLGYNFNHGRQDYSEHPFSTSFHPTDCRITTKIKEDDVMFGIGASIHECGHALYEQGLPEKFYGTPLAEANSYGIHESQSRFYETRIGLSNNFWQYYFPILKSHFLSQLKDISKEDFYKGINEVIPGPVRLEADELTYNLHIIIRFEIEKLMINSEVSVNDLPALWNQKYKEYLGIEPTNNTVGILQDVHWSLGSIGYFPSYILGTMYASQIYEKMYIDMPDMEANIRTGEFSQIREWLRTNIHAKGRSKKPEELIEAITGKAATVKPYINYLTKKYSDIYEL